MIISLCIPCMNRTYTLKDALPTMIKSANASSPVEIVILNYSSKDDLEEYIGKVKHRSLSEDNTLKLVTVTGNTYFHMAHARNLAMLAGSGEYLVSLGADILLHKDFITFMRIYIKENNPVWMTTYRDFGGVVVCKRQEFIDAGGYDERFEFYGVEDRDLLDRLRRRGGKYGCFPLDLVEQIYTPNDEKVKNYDLKTFEGQKLVKRAMSKRMLRIYEENNINQVLVANEGKEWGKYD